MASLFPHLDEYTLLRYDPADTERGGAVEQAITDVSRGLARFGTEQSLEQIVLWDVAVRGAGDTDFQVVIPRGTKYEIAKDGRPEVRVPVPAPAGVEGVNCYGLYEKQLNYRYLFGIVDVPGPPEGAKLEIQLRRDSLFPALAVQGPGGRVLRRDLDSGWPDDARTRADVERLQDGYLVEFFEEDAEYLPDVGFRHFERVPLIRPLRVDDYVEWTLFRRSLIDDFEHTRRRGTITRIQRCEDREELQEMDSWDVRDFVFHIRDADRTRSYELRTCNGAIRLAPRPDKYY